MIILIPIAEGGGDDDKHSERVFGQGGWEWGGSYQWEELEKGELFLYPDGDGGDAELQNVKYFTRSKSSKPNFTPRKARKSRQN